MFREYTELRDKAADLYGCLREESFVKMIPFLGNDEKLDDIRLGSRDKSHCRWLAADPSACSCLPVMASIPRERHGESCPNNPLVNNAERIAKLESARSFYDAVDHCAAVSLIGIANPAVMGSDEWVLTQLCAQQRRDKELSFIAEIASAMLGAATASRVLGG